MLVFFFPLTLSVKLNLWSRGPLFLLFNLAPFLLHLFSGNTKRLHANILVCSCSAQNSTYTSPMNTISRVLIFLRLFRIVVQMEIVSTGGSANTCRDCFYIVPFSFFPFSDFTTGALLKLYATIPASTSQWEPAYTTSSKIYGMLLLAKPRSVQCGECLLTAMWSMVENCDRTLLSPFLSTTVQQVVFVGFTICTHCPV